MRYLAPLLAIAFATIALMACSQGPSSSGRDEAKAQEATGPEATGPEIVEAPASGDVATLVAAEIIEKPTRTVIVYVSADWCEPCVHLERAVKSGELRAEFPTLELFKFDFDRDEERLAQSGYTADLIPLLAVPAPDGRATERRMEGSIKGPESVPTNLVPRMHRLLDL